MYISALFLVILRTKISSSLLLLFLLIGAWYICCCVDALVFLYPPSQDSVVQVTQRALNSCSLADPLLRLDDGNSLFNLTAPGYYYFTSGVAGHCEKNQKLLVAVPTANGTFVPPPADAPVAPPGASQTHPIIFGPTPAQGSSGAPATAVGASAAAGSLVAAVLLLGLNLG